MTPGRTLALAVFFAGLASAQNPAEEWRSKIGNVRYTPLAEAARVQGDVRLKLSSGVVTLISGSPLLVETSIASAKAIQSAMDVDVTFHFVLVDNVTSVPVLLTVPKGNAFERAVLRMFGLKTEKVVLTYNCQENAPPANDIKVSTTVIDIWVYGKSLCLETEATTLIARR